MLLFLFLPPRAFASLLSGFSMPRKADNCTSLGLTNKERCIVCRNPKDRATLIKWGRKCLMAKARAEQAVLLEPVFTLSRTLGTCRLGELTSENLDLILQALQRVTQHAPITVQLYPHLALPGVLQRGQAACSS